MNFQQIRDFVNPAVAQATGLQEVANLSMPVPAAFLANGNGGGSVTVDTELSETSTNPVENRVITAALNNIGANIYYPVTLTFDADDNPQFSKTFSEIQAAYHSAKIPVLRVLTTDGDDVMQSEYIFGGEYEVEQVQRVSFYNITYSGGRSLYVDIIMLDANNTMHGNDFNIGE